MTDLTPRPPRVPKELPQRIYSLGERAILNPFKAEYRHAGSPTARKHIYSTRIWPAIYLYWHETMGITAAEDFAMKAKVLAKWIHNTWRPHHTGGQKGSILTVRKADIIWLKQRDKVMEEIAILLGVPEATTSTEGWFEHRTPAIRQVLLRMTAEETRQLEEEIKEIQRKGYPEEERRILAEKHCTRRLDDSATAHWLEMGALTISFVAYMTPDGQLGIETHDIAAALANVSQDSFEDLHPSPVREMQRLWLEYVRDITNTRNGSTPMVNVPGGHDLSITHDEDGYPLLPASLQVEKLTKKAGGCLLREYLKEHYNLASYRQNSHVPYGDLTKNITSQRKFIKNKYLPPGFVVKDPHNMTLADLKRFIQFLLDRQSATALPQVFRFSCFKTARKGGKTMKSLYPDKIDSNNPPVFTRGRKDQSGAGITNDKSDSEDENPIADGPHTEQGSVQTAPAPAPSYSPMPQPTNMPVGRHPNTTHNPEYNGFDSMPTPNLQFSAIDNSNMQNAVGNPMTYSQNGREDYGYDWGTAGMDDDPVGWAASNAMDPFDEHMWMGTQGYNGQMPMFGEFGLGYNHYGQDNTVNHGVDLSITPSRQNYEEHGQSNAMHDADADADATANPNPNYPLPHVPRAFIAGSSGITASGNAENRRKRGRRADDIAREKAEVLGGQIGDKRIRKERVRKS